MIATQDLNIVAMKQIANFYDLNRNFFCYHKGSLKYRKGLGYWAKATFKSIWHGPKRKVCCRVFCTCVLISDILFQHFCALLYHTSLNTRLFYWSLGNFPLRPECRPIDNKLFRIPKFVEIHHSLGPLEDQFLANSEFVECYYGNCRFGHPGDPCIISVVSCVEV